MNSNQWFDVACAEVTFLEPSLILRSLYLHHFILFFLLYLFYIIFGYQRLVTRWQAQNVTQRHLIFLFQFMFLAPFCWVRSLNISFNEIKRWCYSHFVLLWWCCLTIAASALASSNAERHITLNENSKHTFGNKNYVKGKL